MVDLSKFFTVFLVLAFVVAVMTFQTGTAFSSYAYVNGIAKGINEIPDIQGLVNIWRSSDEPDFDIDQVSSEVDSEQGFWDSALSFFESVGDFFRAVGRFFVNVWDSIMYIVDMVVKIISLIPLFMPWNAVVPI